MLTTIWTSLIAIVDDDPSVRRSLRRVVQSAGYRVETFPSGRAFLDSLPRARPDCVVLDLHLNGSGFDLQERLTADGMSIPIIFITADDDAPTRKRIEMSGAAGHLWKPFDDQALLDVIVRAIDGTTMQPHGGLQ